MVWFLWIWDVDFSFDFFPMKILRKIQIENPIFRWIFQSKKIKHRYWIYWLSSLIDFFFRFNDFTKMLFLFLLSRIQFIWQPNFVTHTNEKIINLDSSFDCSKNNKWKCFFFLNLDFFDLNFIHFDFGLH